MRALLLSSWWQLRNAVRTTLTEPRKLLPLLIIGGIFSLNALSVAFAGQLDQHQAMPVISDFVARHTGAARAILFAVLVLGAVGQIESGLTGGALTFPMADIDFLFPAPISRRAVLAFRVPAIVLRNLFQAALLLFIAYVVLWRLADVKDAGRTSALLLWVAVAGWLTGYTCLAMALEVALGLKRGAALRKVVWVLVIGMVGWVAYLFWQGGMDGLASLERSWLAVPFYPCVLLTRAFLAPLLGFSAGSAAAQLAVFAALSLAVLLSRNDNYYETAVPGSERAARIREAARQGNIAGVLALRSQGGGASSGAPARSITIPRFGRGAAAVFWAHIAAAAKRPYANFIVPLASGCLLSYAATVWAPRGAIPIIVIAAFYYTQFVLMMAMTSTFRQAVGRRSLIGPLPLPARKIVLADVLPTALLGSLFGWGAVPVLLFVGGRSNVITGIGLGVLLPAALCAFSGIQYIVALWYPSGEDRLQQMLAGMVSMGLLVATGIVLALFIGAALALDAPHWLVAVVGLAGCLVVAFFIWLSAAAVYSRVEVG